MNKNALAIAAAAALSAPAVALALPTVYSSESDFLLATGALAAPLPNPGPIFNAPPDPAVLTGSPISLTDMRYIVEAPEGIWASYGRRLLGISDDEDFTAVSTAPLNAFGFSVFEPTSSALNGCNETCFETTFSFELFSGATSLGAFTLAPADNQWAFWGVSSTESFDRVVINDVTGTIDNELFSQFWYASGLPDDSTGGSTAVSEPGTLALFLVGALVARRRLRRT
jgi:hypothetical protein